jgi:hypothetical protein
MLFRTKPCGSILRAWDSRAFSTPVKGKHALPLASGNQANLSSERPCGRAPALPRSHRNRRIQAQSSRFQGTCQPNGGRLMVGGLSQD